MGFPSPAADYVETRISLDALCNQRPSATYYFRSGNCAPSVGIVAGALIVVDSSLQPEHNAIVCTGLDDHFRIRRYIDRPFRALQDINHPENIYRLDSLDVEEGEREAVWGVVTFWLTPAAAIGAPDYYPRIWTG